MTESTGEDRAQKNKAIIKAFTKSNGEDTDELARRQFIKMHSVAPDEKEEVEEVEEITENEKRESLQEVKKMEDEDYAIFREGISKRTGITLKFLDGIRERAIKEHAADELHKMQQEQAESSTGPTLPAWVLDLQASKDCWITGNLTMVAAFLMNDDRFLGLLASNELSGETWVMARPPWYVPNSDKFPRLISEHDYSGLAAWLASPAKCGYTVREPGIKSCVMPALEMVAQDHKWNPIKTWLESLVWDGVERVDRFLSDIIQVPMSEYYTAVSRVLLIAPCRRIETPGCKMDYMPILYSGKQGYYKSSMITALYGAEWTRSLSPRAITNGNDAKRELQGVWAIEMPELEAMAKADVEAVKALVSEQSDSWVPKYVETTKVRPRVPIIIGTTNNPAPLRDSTGNRRFLMINCEKKIDIDYVRNNRNQLFAEAWKRRGESVLIDGPAVEEAEKLQENACENDDWDGLIRAYLLGDGYIDGPKDKIDGPLEIYRNVLKGLPDRYNNVTDGRRISKILRSIGWERAGNGRLGHWWRPKKV